MISNKIKGYIRKYDSQISSLVQLNLFSVDKQRKSQHKFTVKKVLIQIDIYTDNIETKKYKRKYWIGDYLPISSKHPISSIPSKNTTEFLIELDLTKFKRNIPNVYSNKYTKIKINSDDDLPF